MRLRGWTKCDAFQGYDICLVTTSGEEIVKDSTAALLLFVVTSCGAYLRRCHNVTSLFPLIGRLLTRRVIYTKRQKFLWLPYAHTWKMVSISGWWRYAHACLPPSWSGNEDFVHHLPRWLRVMAEVTVCGLGFCSCKDFGFRQLHLISIFDLLLER